MLTSQKLLTKYPVMMQVRDAFKKKVSRERVGAELDGMFNGESGICCLAYAAMLIPTS